MWPFVYEESYWVLINDDLHKEKSKHERTDVDSVFILSVCVQTCRDVRLYARTLRMKSGGVPGLTVGLKTPSW